MPLWTAPALMVPLRCRAGAFLGPPRGDRAGSRPDAVGWSPALVAGGDAGLCARLFGVPRVPVRGPAPVTTWNAFADRMRAPVALRRALENAWGSSPARTAKRVT